MTMANLQRIKDLAEKQNISVRELADRVGLKENQIHVMCRTNSTKIDTLEKIASVLGVSIAYFFDDDVHIEQYHATGERGLAVKKIDVVDQRDVTVDEIKERNAKIQELQSKLIEAQQTIIKLMEQTRDK